MGRFYRRLVEPEIGRGSSHVRRDHHVGVAKLGVHVRDVRQVGIDVGRVHLAPVPATSEGLVEAAEVDVVVPAHVRGRRPLIPRQRDKPARFVVTPFLPVVGPRRPLWS